MVPLIDDGNSTRTSGAAEAEAVRRWGNSKQGKADVVIVRKIPFAPLIALGFAVFYLFQLLR